MSLDHRKELTPVLYGENAVKMLNCFSLAAGRQCFASHWHERMELLLVTEGSLQLSVDKQQVCITASELGLIPPCAMHHGIAGKDGVTYQVLMFDVAVFINHVRGTRRLLNAFLNGGITFPPCVQDTAAIEAVKNILQTRDKKGAASPLFVTAQVYLLFDRLFEELSLPQGRTDTAVEPWFADIRIYIDEHLTEPLTVKGLSARVGYAESYFCRRFKAITGLSPGRYVCVQRLERAKRLIEDGMTSVAAVASACGFTDSDYFTRCFRKNYGYTPTRYMALQKET